MGDPWLGWTHRWNKPNFKIIEIPVKCTIQGHCVFQPVDFGTVQVIKKCFVAKATHDRPYLEIIIDIKTHESKAIKKPTLAELDSISELMESGNMCPHSVKFLPNVGSPDRYL